MSGGTISQGAAYSPLAQDISDSDTSEEELHSNISHLNNHALDRKAILSPKISIREVNGKTMGDYRPFGNEDVGYVSVNGAPRHLSPTRDDVRILKPDDDPRGTAPMGPVRRALFISSIALCFITVIVFLWVLPCNWGACLDTCHKSSIKSWERILNRLELKGSISVVPGVEGRGRNLVLMGRCKVINETMVDDDAGNECSTATDGGLISLIGSSGAIAWWKPLHGLPREINCSLIDVNKNGVEDCIVVGAKGLFAAVNPISGTMIWYLHSVNNSLLRPSELAFPLILPDLDGDGVSELMTSCSFVNDTQSPAVVTEHNYLIFISGKTGTILGQPYRVPKCSRIHNLQLERYLNISYVCEDNIGKEFYKKTTLRELYTMITNESVLNTKSFKTADMLKQHKSLGRTKVINGPSKTYDYAVNGRRLTLENRGRCPLHCSVSVRVIDQRPGQGNEMIWNYTAENMYAMVPATLLFNNLTLANGTILTEPISGFVLKFWQWNYVLHEDLKAESTTSSNPLFRNRLRRALKWSSQRLRRGIQPPLKHTPNTSVHLLKERVVLITFNATDMHIVNASQNDVTQLCIHVDSTEEIICQPDLAFQEQSLLIADLDQDGSQELVSYFTTYVSSGPDEMSGPWRLQSKIRAIRLEAELPKLYEAVARQ